MTAADSLVTTSPDARLLDVAGVLAQHEFDQLPVVEGDHLLGAVTRADIMREFETREALDIRDRPAAGRTGAVEQPQAVDA
jgi:predicted transcriptional regulator